MSGWPPFFNPAAQPQGRALYSTGASGWLGSTESSDEQMDELLDQQEDLLRFVRERQQFEELPNAVWQVLGDVSRQLQELRQQVQSQQGEIAALKQPHEASLPTVGPDAFQRWKAAHRKELEKYRGLHVAIDPQRGVVASAEDYARLVDRLEQLGTPDDKTVIDFIPSYFRAK